MPNALVTIDSFTSVTTAALARARLESEGIRCHVTNEHTSAMSQGIAPALLQVHTEDVERARAILREDVGDGRVDPEDGPVCPHCGGQYADTERGVWSVIAAIVTLGRVAVRRYSRCRKCGHAWTPVPARGDPYRS